MIKSMGSAPQAGQLSSRAVSVHAERPRTAVSALDITVRVDDAPELLTVVELLNEKTGSYEVEPVLTPKADRFSCRFLTEGPPEIYIVSPLRDVEVKSESDYRKQTGRPGLVRAVLSAALGRDGEPKDQGGQS